MNPAKLLLVILPVLALTACATTREWSASGGNRNEGIVKLSYQYPQFQQPALSDAKAAQLAENRCNVWGFARADVIPGQVRECSETDGGDCTLWTVTREYQCSGDAKMARQADEGGGDGAVSTRLAPYRVAR
jgi:hypothetical protein